MKVSTKERIVKCILKILPVFTICVLCLGAFVWRRQWELHSETVVFVNMLALIIFTAIICNCAKQRSINWYHILLILCPLFFFNKLNDEEIFLKTFHFEISLFWKCVCIIMSCVVLGQTQGVKSVVRKAKSLCNTIVDKWDMRKEAEEQQLQIKQKVISAKREKGMEFNKINNKKIQEDFETVKVENKTGSGKKTGMVGERTYVILFIVILLILVVGTILLGYVVASTQTSDLLIKVNSDNLLTTGISLAMIIILLIFVTGIIVSILIKWTKIIFGIFRKDGKKELYFAFACCLFIFSQNLYANSSYNNETFADLIVEGRLFTFPLVLSILIPVFLIFAENIIVFFRDQDAPVMKKIREIGMEYGKRALEISKGILDALFSFIEFATSDFLTLIIDLVKEDLDEDET